MTEVILARKKLPDTREGHIFKVAVDADTGGTYDLYINVNKYPDTGKIAEVFVSVGLNGAMLQGLLDGWCTLLSMALQYGVPLEVVHEKFVDQHFMPAGHTSSKDFPKCSSLFDLIIKILMRYESGTPVS